MSTKISQLTAATTPTGPESLAAVQSGNSRKITVSQILTADIGLNGLTVGRGFGGTSTNTAVGVSALAANTGGDRNTAVGSNALKANTGTALTNGRNNVGVGADALLANTTGQQNVAVGGDTLFTNATGDNNVGVGNGALGANIGGSSNVAIGTDSLRVSLGSSNTAIGVSALQNVTSNGGNTAVGSGALLTTTGSSSVALGFAAGKYETGSNAFYVDNQDRTNTAGDKANAILYGVMASAAANQTLQQNAIVTKPVQPAFLVTASAGTDVTGDATVATVAWGTEIYDQHNDFASNTFTAPVTGRYHFNVSIRGDQLAVGNTLFLVTLVTSNRSIVLVLCNPSVMISGGSLLLSGCTDVDMDAADTATVTFRVDGGTKIVDIATSSSWSGHLVC